MPNSLLPRFSLRDSLSFWCCHLIALASPSDEPSFNREVLCLCESSYLPSNTVTFPSEDQDHPVEDLRASVIRLAPVSEGVSNTGILFFPPCPIKFSLDARSFVMLYSLGVSFPMGFFLMTGRSSRAGAPFW